MSHLHSPKATTKNILVITCPDCKRRTRMLQFYTPWYGWYSTCLLCGRQRQGGEWMRLPFTPGKHRSQNIKDAKKRWKSMPDISENHFELKD